MEPIEATETVEAMEAVEAVEVVETIEAIEAAAVEAILAIEAVGLLKLDFFASEASHVCQRNQTQKVFQIRFFCERSEPRLSQKQKSKGFWN